MTPDAHDPYVTRYVPVTRKADLNPDQFDRYWGDVHGPLCAGLPSLERYVQYHLAPPQSDLWFAPPDVATRVPEAETFDGVADCGFATGADFADWLAHAQPLLDDEQNCFAATYGYYSTPVTGGSPQDGAPGAASTSIALIRRRPRVHDAAFRAFIDGELAAAFDSSPLVLGHRQHVFDPYGEHEKAWQADNVDHARGVPVRHHAAVELTVEDPSVLPDVFGAEAYRRTLPGQSRLVAAVHAYPVRYEARFVEHGVITLAGTRGWSTARLIDEVGARPPVVWT